MYTCPECGCSFDVTNISQCPNCRLRRASEGRPATLVHLSPSDATDVGYLIQAVVARNPEYLPGVAAREVSLNDWYTRKRPDWALGLVVDGHLVAHLGAWLNVILPNQVSLDDARSGGRRSWEATMVVTHPAHRRRGHASRLLTIAARQFGNRLWVTAHDDQPGAHLLTNLGWTQHEQFSWPRDPNPGHVYQPPPTV